mmetsp:Transcript_1299/g.4717  ORF Transcript_1299/g.4717 Transcript_1299/m.4717 type:complete len:215 (-) Transcript_1299:187-831(-)
MNGRARRRIASVDILTNSDEILHRFNVAVARRVVQRFHFRRAHRRRRRRCRFRWRNPTRSRTNSILSTERIIQSRQKRLIIRPLHHRPRSILLQIIKEIRKRRVILQTRNSLLHIRIRHHIIHRLHLLLHHWVIHHPLHLRHLRLHLLRRFWILHRLCVRLLHFSHLLRVHPRHVRHAPTRRKHVHPHATLRCARSQRPRRAQRRRRLDWRHHG